MVILQIGHRIQSFDGWKKAFDNDPVDRKKLGVRRYRIFQPVDDLNYVFIELEFDTIDDAETTLAALRRLWPQVEGKVMFNPQTRILKEVHAKEY